MTDRYEELLLPGQRDRIVTKVVAALKTQGRLSTKTLNDFRDSFKAGKPIPGFNNDPLRAMPPLLKQQLLERMGGNPDLEELIVGAWTDIESGLRDTVSEHLEGIERAVFLADEPDEEFWDAQVALLADKRADYEEDDVLLMTKVCYARAKMQADLVVAESGKATDSGGASESYLMEDALDSALDSLRNMPAAFPQWRESIPRFVEAVEEIIRGKKRELVRVKGITNDLIHIQGAFRAELSFFREQDDEWDAPIVATFLAEAQGVDGAGRSLSELKEALATYRRIKERADTLGEERERREQRHELEEAIEGVLNEIDEISRAAEASGDGAVSEHESDSVDAQPQPEADPALLEDVRALRDERESLLASNRDLQGEVAGLQADKRALDDEVAELRDQLRISEAKEMNWRSAYEATMSGSEGSESEPIPVEIESVRRAVDLARGRYGDRLVFRLNKKSEPDYNYRRPKEVWDGLEWLATTYYDSQTGKARVIDLNESIRNTCGGWEYKPNQTDITFNTYREWYTATKDGKTYELREHIGKGTGRNANVIRIAFAWDEDSERVIVGYVGPHQRSRSS